jgi:iron complex outermembrane recepter protein
MTTHFASRRSLFAAALFTSTCSLPSIAYAQDTAVPLPVDDATPTDAEMDGGDIVVTATKRETNLQDTPIAISVVSAETLENRRVQSMLDLVDGAVPSLRVTTFESRQTALTVGIRGIVPNDANQPAREQGVGVYLDGVYLGRQQGLNATMLDIERVEVLRGPQGTLFGRNTEGGALSLVTRRPTGEFGLRATAGLSNFGGYSAQIHLDLPEVAGFAVKLDGALQYHDATTRNPMEGETGWNYVNRRGFRAQIRYRGIEGLDAIYSYDNGYGESTPFLSQLVSYNPLNLPVSTLFPRPAGTISPLPPQVRVRPERQSVADVGVPQQPSVDRTFGHALHLNLDLSDDIELRSITAYREVEAFQYDNAGGPNRPPVFQPNAPAGSSARNFSRYSLSDLYQWQASQEFQLVGSLFDGATDFVVGLYYFEEEASEEAATPSTLTYIGSNGDYVVRDPIVAGITRGFRSIDRGSRARSQSSGVFVHTTTTLPEAPNFHLTLGGRFTRDEKSGVLYRVSNQPRDFRFELTETRFDPLVTLSYDFSDDINVYATYSTGYRAGGANSRSLTYTAFESEEVDSLEFGFKSRLFDQLTLNVAGYVMNRTNSQIEFTLVAPDPVTGNTRNTVETVNAPGITKIRGIEIESVWDVNENLRLSASYAWTYTRVPDAQNPFPASAACPSCGTVQPVFIIYTPPHAFTASLDYTQPLGFGDLIFHIDGNYAEGTQSFEQSAQKTDDSFIVNARLAIANVEVDGGPALTFSLWSRNLFNESHIYRRSTEGRSGTNAIGDYANFNEPRTFGFDVSVRF